MQTHHFHIFLQGEVVVGDTGIEIGADELDINNSMDVEVRHGGLNLLNPCQFVAHSALSILTT
jgi:hypothetical protein